MSILYIILITFSGISFIVYGWSVLVSSKMQSEFKRFGLEKFHKLIGILQLLGGFGLLAGLFSELILIISSGGLALLMLIGFGVRHKIKDGFWLSMPSLLFFLLNSFIFVGVQLFGLDFSIIGTCFFTYKTYCMEWIKIVIQVVIAASIFNVWIFRIGKPTTWRGGTAKSMKEEFEAYGLPDWVMKIVGFLKLAFASVLLAGIYWPVLIMPAATGMAVLMLGAISMHIKIKDPLIKSFPAFSFLVLSLILIFV